MVVLFFFLVSAITVLVPLSYIIEFDKARGWERAWEPRPPECTRIGGVMMERMSVIPLPPPTLEELVSGADVIVRARLQSVASTIERWHVDNPDYGPVTDEIGRIAALEYTFAVVEYLNGTGADEVVGVAIALDWFGRSTMEDAVQNAACALAERNTRWDGREAILLLTYEDYAGFLVDFPQADRYELGGFGPSSYYGDHHYTPLNLDAQGWLPAASAALGASSASNSARFLLSYPSGSRSVDWVIPNKPAPAFTLTQLKAAIRAVEQESANGG